MKEPDANSPLTLRDIARQAGVSHVPSSRRHHDVAAGRTAGALIGRLVGPRSGDVAIVAGSQGLRDHAEGIFGFNQMMASEFPGLNGLPVFKGRDQDERSQQQMSQLLGKHPDIVGLYPKPRSGRQEYLESLVNRYV